MSNPEVPAAIEDAARRRSEARAAADWVAADGLRAEIEAAGWRVIDSGTSYRLEPANPPDVEVGGEIRYGRSDAVPSRLGDPSTGLASVIIVASPDREETAAAFAGLAATAPDGAHVVLVSDGLGDRNVAGLIETSALPAELVRTSEPLGYAAALNLGTRRARAPIVIVLDPSIVPSGDVVTPLVRALDDPTVAIAGPFGLTSSNLRQFDEVDVEPGGPPLDAAAIQGYLMAFRRADVAARGPFDEGFRFYRNLDIWWSLVLRDEDEGKQARRALVVPALPVQRGEPHAWRFTKPADRDRLSKRNFYRVLDRFRDREDLAV